jgi:hypothetical protein
MLKRASNNQHTSRKKFEILFEIGAYAIADGYYLNGNWVRSISCIFWRQTLLHRPLLKQILNFAILSFTAGGSPHGNKRCSLETAS